MGRFMLSLSNRCKSFVSDESGANSIEYALIASIVSLCIVAGLTSARNSLSTTFNKVGSELGSNVAN